MKNLLKIVLLLVLNSTVIYSQSDDCSYGGTAITVGTTCTTSSFNSNNNTDYWDGATGCSASDNDDAWWWFTATNVNTTITYNSLNDAIMHIFTGACATNMTSLTCVNATTSGNETINLATTIGQTYAIRIQRNASDINMTGNICVYSPCTPTVPVCATSPSPAIAATNVAICSTALSWTAPASSGCNAATSYDVYFRTSSTPPFVTNTTSTSYTLTTLAPNTTYYWQIIPKNATGDAIGCSIYSFTTTLNVNYSTVGNATSTSPYNCTTLTTATNSQKGCAWDVNSTLDFSTAFSYDFAVNLGSSDGGADGIAFVMQNDPDGVCACGDVGGAMGAANISNSLIIELDTYLNFEDRDDFCGGDALNCTSTTEWDHLDVWTGSTFNPDLDANCNAVAGGERPYVPCAVPLKSGGSLYNIENGLNHIMRVSWAPGSPGTITVTILDASGTTTYGTISYSFNPATVFGTSTPFFGMTASTGGLNNNQSFCLPAAFLPIELISFDANCESGNMKLTWSTASEINNDYFTIERSLNGIIYSPLAQITGSGTTSLQHNYTWYDESPAQGVNYYRIRQTDYNSESAYYKVAASSCEKELPFSEIKAITPDEVLFSVNLKEDEKVSFILLDALGRELTSKSTIMQRGDNLYSIPISNFSKGFYLISVSSSFEHCTHKVALK